MAEAIALGARGRVDAPPNPWVGCVITHGERVVGEGYHARAGAPHAEVVALQAAGDAARGATVYVTLEPCAHQGRTPPCADALVTAGVARVVVALVDPDPQVQGRGIEHLRAAGITVDVGVGAAAARASLAPYLHHRGTGRAFCLAKAAVSLDGRSAAADGSSRWITGPDARRDAHRLRAESQAVVVGAGTALLDRPQLTVRDVEAPHRPPLRVVLDAAGRVPAEGPLFDVSTAPTLVITTEAAPRAAVDAWRSAGAKVETVAPARTGSGVDLEAALSLLGAEGVVQAMVEGGPILLGALVAADLADRLVLYIGGMVLGAAGRPALDWPGPPQLDGAPRFALADVARLGDDLRLDFDRPDSDLAEPAAAT